MFPKTGAGTLALLAGLVGGCTQQNAGAPQSHATLYATDLQGKAAMCTVPTVQPETGKTVTATMTTGGGGWCGLTVADGTKPYAAGLVDRRPEKGRVYIHTVGDDTRVDYTPDSTPMPDNFSVLLIPGDATLAVTVQPVNAPVASSPLPNSLPAAAKPTATAPASKGSVK